MHSIDIEESAVKNTLTNAFRNGVADRVSAATQDLNPWVPEERYDLIVASLFQMPVDPFEQVTTHRPLDYWGRSEVSDLFRERSEQIERVEELSDAYHLRLDDTDVVVAYLLEITHQGMEGTR